MGNWMVALGACQVTQPLPTHLEASGGSEVAAGAAALVLRTSWQEKEDWWRLSMASKHTTLTLTHTSEWETHKQTRQNSSSYSSLVVCTKIPKASWLMIKCLGGDSFLMLLGLGCGLSWCFSSRPFFFKWHKDLKRGWVCPLVALAFLSTWKKPDSSSVEVVLPCFFTTQEPNHAVQLGECVQLFTVWAYRVTRERNHSEFQVSASCCLAFVQLFILTLWYTLGHSQWDCVHQIMAVSWLTCQ